MDQQSFERLETQVRNTARRLPYPDTPDISQAESVRQIAAPGARSPLRLPLAWAAAALLLILLLAALATPSVRAAVLDFIQVGVVRILQTAPTPSPEARVNATPLPAAIGTAPPVPTLKPTPVDLVSLLDLAGETTLAEARAKVPFPIRLPAYPADLGPPDRVFLQNHDGSVLILVWTQPGHPDKARLSLHTIEPGSWTVEKVKPVLVQETSVNGRPAVWAVGPYFVNLRNGNLDIRRLIDGNVLIWTEQGLTYRLETDLPLEEAVRIAESLK
jgi:hypothetical protein